MLRIAIHPTAALSSISRDGKLLPVVEANIKMTIEETVVHLVLVESDGQEIKKIDEIVRGHEEEIVMVTLEGR